MEVFKVDSALSLTNGSDEQSPQGLGFKAYSQLFESQVANLKKMGGIFEHIFCLGLIGILGNQSSKV